MAAIASAAQAVTLSFELGVIGDPVGANFAPFGVTFSDTVYASNFGEAGTSGSVGIGSSSAETHRYGEDAPLVATFSVAQAHVGFSAADVGGAGIRLDAYDSLDNLIGSASAFGTGAGAGTFHEIDVYAAGIFSVKIYQPGTANGSNPFFDDVIVDNFRYEAAVVPEPAAWALLIGGFGMAGAALRRRRSAVA